MSKTMKIIMLSSFLGAFLLGINAFAERSVKWQGFPEGAATERTWPPYDVLAVFEGQIKSLDLEKMEIKLEGIKKLGDKPLMLSKDTRCYKGGRLTNIASVKGGTKFQGEDVISFDHLKAGDYIKCNYSIKDGKFLTVRIVLITPYRRME